MENLNAYREIHWFRLNCTSTLYRVRPMFWRMWHSTHQACARPFLLESCNKWASDDFLCTIPHVKSGCKMLLSQNSVRQAHPGSSKHVQICAKSVKVDNVDFASSFMFFDWYKGDKDNQVDTQCCLGSADINDQRQKLVERIWCWIRWRKQTMFSQSITPPLGAIQKSIYRVGPTSARELHHLKPCCP